MQMETFWIDRLKVQRQHSPRLIFYQYIDIDSVEIVKKKKKKKKKNLIFTVLIEVVVP